jgi:hypothetical protein
MLDVVYRYKNGIMAALFNSVKRSIGVACNGVSEFRQLPVRVSLITVHGCFMSPKFGDLQLVSLNSNSLSTRVGGKGGGCKEY